MLISMPQQTSSNFGVVQSMVLTFLFPDDEKFRE